MSSSGVSALLEAAAQARHGRIALEWKTERLTFGDIESRVIRMARALSRRDLRPGDRLSVYLPNSLEVVDIYLACARLGIIYVPINILYREREIDHILRDAEPRAIVSDRPVPSRASMETWPVADLAHDAAGQPADRLDAPPVQADAPAAIIYTSGTTGAAKGAVLTQHNFVANARRLVEAWRITSDDRLLLALPLFHVHGLGNGLHAWLAAGARMRLLERFDAATAPAELLEFKATLFFGVPTMFVRLLETEPDLARRLGRQMRLFVSGSAPLPAQVLEQFRSRFAHAILERYGMSETLMTTSNPYDGERRAGTVGVPLPGVEVRLLDAEGRDVADGESGELYVRSDAVFAGYFRQPQATGAAFDDGWFRTGDLATRSLDGYYTLQGRRSDVIISGGFNIYPREIEEFLLEQEGVAEAALVGVPDPVRGEVPVAYIVARFADERLDAGRLEAACREKLASFKVPRRFVQVERLPRTALGKVQKHLLKPEP
jgi:malonyl-CoA/methylmalonyl-CoA synthetase